MTLTTKSLKATIWRLFVASYNDKPLWIAPKETPVGGLNVPRGTLGFIIKNRGNLTHTFDQLIVSDDGLEGVMIGTYDLIIQKSW